jgi:tRNA (guanine-N7-)-methyltransferase
MSSVAGYRLPIGHPEYQYPASRNPYWAKLLELKGSVFSDNETETHSGVWRSQFEDHSNSGDRKLHVEIGCNAGHVIVEWATAQPRDAYIGIDWKFKPIFRGVEKAQKRNLKNLVFFRAHAERLTYMFGPDEIDHLALFFPDPWPRKSQWKNRFITVERLKEISKIVKKTGVFHIKTDHRGYFDWMLEAVEQSKDSWNVLEMSMNLHQAHPAPQSLEIPEVTLFEKLFIRDGLPIHSLKLQPR